MKKRAFTLIEVIIVISILSIISGITYIGINNYFKTKSKLTFESTVSDVRRLLSYGKQYCRKYKVKGYILVDIRGKTVQFSTFDLNHNITKEIEIDKDIIITSKFNSNNIEISEKGFIKSSGTITIIYNNEYKKEIKVGVGNDIIGIKDGDLIE
ncbi:prepilin-type N-terminal cleavage/methylation domain-containing protein [Caproiciproducens sp. MSJ-32]|uniref:prepilin-type N-terminal cleavage/methylation domain-containing protein n=1 Tax=Caproiciproducens sp. MSJ-32 TaxID=2841527 RepID=UPI001C127E22|nr:prepilin-type N-terminal cleavage/methylation domain-containing protein [Caproiciproducens sp. MSJ-32]MBU5454593.1 prepilin-type N-terminal cleavage/methylation domain-containing protein [Caproiciproducens sp. MSJ-32]